MFFIISSESNNDLMKNSIYVPDNLGSDKRELNFEVVIFTMKKLTCLKH